MTEQLQGLLNNLIKSVISRTNHMMAYQILEYNTDTSDEYLKNLEVSIKEIKENIVKLFIDEPIFIPNPKVFVSIHCGEAIYSQQFSDGWYNYTSKITNIAGPFETLEGAAVAQANRIREE